jgi:rubrerythrin
MPENKREGSDMADVETLGELSELTISLAHSVEATYRGLAAMFSHEPEIAQFWNLMAEEEANHARWLTNLHQNLDEHLRHKRVDPRFCEGVHAVLEVPAETRLEKIGNLDEALHMALAFETAETNAVFDFLISDYQLATRAREFLRNQVVVHVERLNKGLPERFRDRSVRAVIPAVR